MTQAPPVKSQEMACIPNEYVQIGPQDGWYEHPYSKEQFYLKFYEDPDQARIEFITNAIYEKLGIKAARSKLVEVNGHLAIASLKIPDSRAVYLEDFGANHEVGDCFVVDAFLGNWDVVGQNYENIIKGRDGLYRINNGGSLVFRAQGGRKTFNSYDIPELETMRNPLYPAGQVFQGITEQEMARQAKLLLERLDKDAILSIIRESGLSGDIAKEVTSGLVGRLEVIRNRFKISSNYTNGMSSSLGEALERLETSSRESSNSLFRNIQTVICDHNHIEGQQINIVDRRDLGNIGINFKLTHAQFNKIIEALNSIYAHEHPLVRVDEISYRSLDNKHLTVSEAYLIEYKGVKIRVAQPERNGEVVRSVIGLVDIEIPCTEERNLNDLKLEEVVNEVLNILGVADGLTPPTLEAIREYCIARYCWHHKKSYPELTPDELTEIAFLERYEVFPGYSTLVSPEKHLEYMSRHGEFASFHRVPTPDRIIQIVKSGGLMSSTERFRRGAAINGMSSISDINSGSADSVFTRTITKNSKLPEDASFPDGYYIIFNPDLYNRTDWYAYPWDKFGSTERSEFDNRITPDQILEASKEPYNYTNEQMFRTGISTSSFEAIACSSLPGIKQILADNLELSAEQIDLVWAVGPQKVIELLDISNIEYINGMPAIDFLYKDPRMNMIGSFLRSGITEVNGKPVAQFVIEVETLKGFVDIANGRKPGPKPLPRTSVHTDPSNVDLV